jgi:hypothetical protein
MSYAAEELRYDIVELFDDAASMSRYREDFGVLQKAVALRCLPIVDEELREEIRLAAPPLPPPPSRVRMTAASQRKQIATLVGRGFCVCSFCGSRGILHRCPVTGGIT